MSDTDCKTCATCRFIGVSYWGHWSDWGGREHHCLKGDDRRRDTMKPTGDIAEDFMRNFRTFFDAKAPNRACRYYEEREPLSPDKLSLLRSIAANDGKGEFPFFSPENRMCSSMSGKFVEENDWARSRRKATDGTRDWVISAVGKAEIARADKVK